MYIWVLGNPDLAHRLVAAERARAEVMSRAGYLAITAVERAVVLTARALGGAYRSLVRWLARNRQRREAIAQLRSLDDRLLSDIGIARGEIVGLVDEALARGPASVSDVRGLKRPVPAANRREAPARDLRLAA
ncbi:MAG: DUF1127 domain-containing protein [Kiloniellales bacterium]